LKLAPSTAGETRQGQKTPVNDDAVCFDPRAGIFAVADGSKRPAGTMGAAHLFLNAVKKNRDILTQTTQDAITSKEKQGTLKAIFQNVFDAGSHNIRETYKVPDGKIGPTTTATVLMIRDGHGAIGHVGNTRAYLLRKGKVFRLTKDHTVAQRKLDAKEITTEEYAAHPKRKTLYQAIGQSKSVQVDVSFFKVQLGDLFLLVSDGVSDTLRGEDLRQLEIKSEDETQFAASALDLAVERNAFDDISCVVVSMVEKTVKKKKEVVEVEVEFLEEGLIDLEEELLGLTGDLGDTAEAPSLEPESGGPRFAPPAPESAPPAGAETVSFEDQLKYFQNIELFKEMSEQQILNMLAMMTPTTLQPGQLLFSQGEPGEAMYVITMGRVDVIRDNRKLVTLGTGTIVGELAVLDGEIRSASIRAERLTRVMGISRDELKVLETKDARFGIMLYRNLSQILTKRLRAASGRR